jgi:hypothetical protein
MTSQSFLLLDIAMALAGGGLSLASLKLWGGGQRNQQALMSALWCVLATIILSAATGHVFALDRLSTDGSEYGVLLLFTIGAVEALALASLIAAGKSGSGCWGVGLVVLWILEIPTAAAALAPGSDQCAAQVNQIEACYFPQGALPGAFAILFVFLSLAVLVAWLILLVRLCFRTDSRRAVGRVLLIGTAGAAISLLVRLPLLPVLRGATSIFSWEGSAVLLLSILSAILAFVWTRRASLGAAETV